MSQITIILIVCLLSVSYGLSVPKRAAKSVATAVAITPDEDMADKESLNSLLNRIQESEDMEPLSATELPELLATQAMTYVDSGLKITLNTDLYPTLHRALWAPFSLLAHVFRDVMKFYEHKSLTQFFSLSSLRSAVMSTPQQLSHYWARLMAMEEQCMYRTICDLADFMSGRLPFWAQQLTGVYFTSNSATSPYYRAVANGMINHNCADYYSQCSLGK